jgi:hypothetical protein
MMSMALALLEEPDFRLAFLTALFAFDNLKKAIALNGNIPIGVRMYRRFSCRHENPILALCVRRQPGTGHGSQA